MVRQRPWDKYESALLLEEYLKVIDGSIERKTAILKVSKLLRERAMRDGEEIDEIFRNVAGITFQMSSMESAYYGYTIKKPATKLFSEIAEMRKNNRVKYDTILKEANRMFFTVDYRAEYQEWLVNSGLQYKAARNYGNWLNNLSSYAVDNGLIENSVYELTVSELVKLCEKLSHDDDFINSHRDYLTSLRKYIAYKSDGEVMLVRTRSSCDASMNAYREEYQEWLISNGLQELAARNYGNWLLKISEYAVYHGYSEKSFYEVNDVPLLVEIYNELLENDDLTENHKDYLTSLRKFIAYKSNGEIQLFRTRSTPKRSAGVNDASEGEKILRTYSVADEEIKNNYPEIYMRLQSMAKVYDDINGFSLEWIFLKIGVSVEKELLKSLMEKLSWITQVDNEVYSFSDKARPMENILIFERDSFVKVLMLRYQNGMRFDSIDFEIFRETYDELIGENINYDDEKLENCLRQCGVIYQNRVFPAEGIIDSNTREKLIDYIRASFEAGKKVLYYKSIYMDLADELSYCFNLTDENMLQAYLRQDIALENFYFHADFMSVEKNVVIDYTTEIEDYFLSEGRPLSYEEAYAGLSHISNDVIYGGIKSNPNLILNEKEHYFHYGIFELSSEDADKISEYIRNDISEEGYCIWSRVFSKIQTNMQLFIENNVYLSQVGIRNAVARKLSGRFEFDCEVICNRGQNLNMAAVYRLYGEHHTPFSDIDIYKFSKEVSGGVIYFDSLSEIALRISKEVFVSKNEVNFDVEATDRALSTYLQTGYMLIRDIDSFLVFPSIGYEWNSFLLESYLLYFSEKYTLVNNGRSLNNVAGALVRKGTGYDEFVDVCADVLANSDIQLTKQNALDCLAEQNLLTRRSYSKIDNAMNIARQIRNKKG